MSGLELWIPSVVGALMLPGLFMVRRPAVVRFSHLPWQLVLLASGLFVVIEAAQSIGLSPLMVALAGKSDDPISLLRLAGSAAGSANLINDLPAYFASTSLGVEVSWLRFAGLGLIVAPLTVVAATLALALT